MSYLGQGLGLGREERFTATATAGQTTVTVGDDGRSISYTPNYVDVYLNGVKMVNGSDITVTSGTSIVFASALAAGDFVDVVAPGYFQPADTVSRSLGGTFLGAVNLPSGGLNVGSGQLRVDSSGRVLKNAQPMCMAYLSANTAKLALWQKVPLNATRFNIGGSFNTATGTFTAPVAGAYFVTHTNHIANDTGGGLYLYAGLYRNGGFYVYTTGLRNLSSWGADNTIGGSTIMSLAAGDTVESYVYTDNANVYGGDANALRSTMGIYLLG